MIFNIYLEKWTSFHIYTGGRGGWMGRRRRRLEEWGHSMPSCLSLMETLKRSSSRDSSLIRSVMALVNASYTHTQFVNMTTGKTGPTLVPPAILIRICFNHRVNRSYNHDNMSHSPP